jgi:branched-chain amino acid transport system ATP-binding protein
VRGVTKRFGGLVALHDITFDVYRGEIVGLMGPNGAGKTTLLNVIAGEYLPDAGTIRFQGHDITRLPCHEVCHRGIARTYQIPQPFLSLTPEQHLQVAEIFGRRRRDGHKPLSHDTIFDLVGLTEKRHVAALHLPLLALKKLELARGLGHNPDLLLLDEVAAGTTEAEIPDILRALAEIRHLGITVLIIEHVIKVLVKAVDRIVVIDKGSKIAEGDPKAVMSNSQVIEAYFGA